MTGASEYSLASCLLLLASIKNFKHQTSNVKLQKMSPLLHFDGSLVERHQSSLSLFCRSTVAMRYLTMQQMQHAAWRYRLGMARDGGVIFWQINILNQVHDGKIMYYRLNCHRDHHHYPTWVSTEIRRCGLPLDALVGGHCLFGSHLLREDKDSTKRKTVCVVEAEKTAFIMSELFPNYHWLASGGLAALTDQSFCGLYGRRIVLYPDTDETGMAYDKWRQVARHAMFIKGTPEVSTFLEEHATPEEKHQKIDLVDYYMARRL